MSPEEHHVLVFDIGKTHVKVTILDQSGEEHYQNRTSNKVLQTEPYHSYDIEGIWAWLKKELTDLSKRFVIQAISIASHGAAAALINPDTEELLLPIMDYEFDDYPEDLSKYANLRPPVEDTGSPLFPAGLNLGRQLHWQSQLLTQEDKQKAALLMYPQYWAWRLSGVLSSEVTSLGCHTDLWNIKTNTPSPLLDELGLGESLPALKEAWVPIGTVKKKLTKEVGLSENCQIYPGVHDSNAGYLPILRQPKNERPAVISSGTWSVIMDSSSDCETLDTARDMLVNIDAERSPLATARYMGGREFGLICERLNTDIATTFTDKDIEKIIQSNTFILPSFCSGTGPYPNRVGHIEFENSPLQINGKAAATVYSSLMVNNILKRLNPLSKQDIIIEGSFASNEVLCRLLATLNPNRNLRTQSSGNGVTQGCFLLTQWDKPFDKKENPVISPYPFKAFISYAAEWENKLKQ